MPRTEAGKRLLAKVNAEPPIGMLLPEDIDAIEAEAVAAERARIRAAVEGLSRYESMTPEWYAACVAVLAIIDQEDTDG